MCIENILQKCKDICAELQKQTARTTYETLYAKNMIKSPENDYSSLNDFKDKAGIYMFIYNDEIVYIGQAGIKTQKLKDRIAQELRCYCPPNQSCTYSKDTGATLSKNIQEVDNKNPDESIEEIKKMELRIFAFNESGKKNISRLEHLLIGICNPKYNNG